MIRNGYSRRQFLKQQSITGLGVLLASSVPSLLNGQRTHDVYTMPDEQLMYFDAFTAIGPRRYKHPAERWRLDELITEMDHCSISAAMVSSTLSVQYDAMYSNLELSNQLRSYSQLFAIWNVLPHQTGEFPEPKELGVKMKEYNIRAIGIHPASNGWDWKADHCHELLKQLSETKTLTIITASELGGWSSVDEFLKRYPSLPVLLVNANWIEQRYLLPLVKTHKNLHISFDHFQINDGIEYLDRNGLSDQMVFATNAPAMSMGAHRTYIDYADVRLEIKKKVAGGNLLRLLGLKDPPATRWNREEDELMASVRRCRPLPTPIIDMHMHILHEGLNGAGGLGYRMENGGPSGVFAKLNRLGVRGGGFMSWNGVVSNDAPAGNICTRKVLDVAPAGFWGLATFDPTHYPATVFSSMIKEVYKDQRFIGMKPYHYYGVEYHNKVYDEWWEYGNQRKFYALLHATRNDLLEIDTLAGRYPNSQWVIAHACGSFQVADMAIEVMKKRPNVFAEITLTPVHSGIIEYLASAVGDDRIVYGSDLPMRDPRQQLGWVVFSRLPVTSKKKILAANARGVIGPCMERLPAANRPVFENNPL